MKNILLVFLVVVFAVGCAESPSTDTKLVQNPPYPEHNEQALDNIEFVKVAEYGLESENMDAVFGSWVSVLPMDDEGVYIYDILAGRVKAFSPKATFLWSRLKKGMGPQELNNTSDLFSYGRSGFVLSNQGNTRVDFFNSDAELQTSILLEDIGLEQSVFYGMLNDSTLVFSKYIQGRYASELVIVSKRSKWQIIDTFVIDVTDGVLVDERLVTYPPIRLMDEMIVVADLDSFRYLFFNRQGEVQKEVNRDLGKLSAPKIVEMSNGYSQQNYSALYAPKRLDKNWVYGQSSWVNNAEELATIDRSSPRESWPKADRETTLDFYDNDMNLIYSLDEETEGKLYDGNILASDGKGHVFTYASSTGLVTKYKVEISR